MIKCEHGNRLGECLECEMIEKVSTAQDHLDLMADEFNRIKTLTPNTEILQICERAITNTHQNVPLIVQRNEALAKVERLEFSDDLSGNVIAWLVERLAENSDKSAEQWMLDAYEVNQ